VCEEGNTDGSPKSSAAPWVDDGRLRGGRPSAQQADISRRLIELARKNKRVLRLKGGDPCMFGRGGEEAIALA